MRIIPLAAALLTASLASGGAFAAQTERDTKTTEEPRPAFEKDAESARKKAVERARELRIRGKGPFLKGMGKKALIAGDLEASKAAFARAVAENPDDDDGYLQLASAAELSGEPAEAARLYTEALTRRPDLAGYYLERRGRVLFQAGLWAMALADAESGLQGKPGDPDLLRLRTKSLINLGEFQRAAASYEESLTRGRRAKTGEDAWICSRLKSQGLHPTVCGS